MKVNNFSVSCGSFVRQWTGVGILSLGLVGCYNYTSSPLCDDENAVQLPGITGSYTLSVQDSETFEVETQQFEVYAPANGILIKKSQQGTDEARTCQVSGWFLQETYDEGIQAYSQDRIFITGMGISFSPIMYDKKSLDAADIPNKIFEMPEMLRKVLGERMTDLLAKALDRLLSVTAAKGFLVVNDDHRAEEILAHAKVAPGGFTLLRQ